jgi:DNA-binding MarR family transcriptional regulator
MIRNIARSREPAVSGQAVSGQEEEILRSMRRIIRAVDLYSRQLIAQTGLSGPQLTCLRALARGGPMQTYQLADAVHLSAATVCGILNRLEQRGLVVRARQSTDRRRVLVSLTEAGEDTVENAPPVLHDKFLMKLRALPPLDQQAVQDALARIVHMMAASELDAAPLLEPGEAVTAGPDDTT